MAQQKSPPVDRGERPFTKATPGGGGNPEGRISKGPLDNPPGGRHAGALLSDPEQTLEKLKKKTGEPT